jgi:hypothetical protein
MIESGRTHTRGIVAASALAACLAVPMMFAPNASALTAPTITVALTGSVTGSANVIGTGCPVTVTATLKQPDGSAVPQGTVEFFDVDSSASNLVLGSAPVSGGIASVSWTPATSGQNAITAGYFDSQLQFLPIAGGAVVTVTPGINIGGFCL